MKDKPLKKYHLALFMIAFVSGIIWGKYFYYGEQEKISEIFKKEELRLLVHSNFLPDDILESFHLEYNTQIIIETYSSTEDFYAALARDTYDLISADTSIQRDLIISNKLSKLQQNLLTNKQNISPDFLSSPLDKQSEYSIPVYWKIIPLTAKGDNANRTPSSTFQDGGLLTTENIAILNSSKNLKKAHLFVDYLLQKEVALELVRFRRQPITNKQVENINGLSEQLKPSYIRKVAISKLKYAL